MGYFINYKYYYIIRMENSHMFKYVGDISKISHYIIDKFLENKNIFI